MSDQIIELSIELKKVPVKLSSKNYSIVELTGLGRDDWMDWCSERIHKDKEGNKLGTMDTKGMQCKLISMTLQDGSGKLVPLETVQTFPGTVCDTLFKLSQKTSALGAAEETAEEAKNA